MNDEAQQPPTPPEQPQAPPPPPQPGPASPLAGPTAAPGLDVTPSAAEVAYPNFPLQLDVGYQQEYSRFMPLVKWLLAIPHYVVLFFLFIGAFVAWIVAWFAVLITGKYPQGIFNFLVGVARWTQRVNAYLFLIVDPYPPFSMDDDPNYPVRFNVDYPPEGKIARWRPLVAWVLVIPQIVIAYLALYAAEIGVFVAFLTILFTKKIPRGLFDFIVNAFRYSNRTTLYAAFATEKYPGFTWG